MRAVRIYTTSWCPYCHRAKRVLEENGVPFTEIDVDGDAQQRAWLRTTTGRHTVPQIFFDEESIGGCDDLVALVRAGKLDERLAR